MMTAAFCDVCMYTVSQKTVQNCSKLLHNSESYYSKLSNDLNSTSKVKCGLLSRIISSSNSSVQNCQNLCSEWAHVHEHTCLDDDATENVKPHLQLHVFCGVVAFAASRLYVTAKV